MILFGYVYICSRVIWLGDLNYRVALSYEKTRLLLEDNDWDSLLEKDQVYWLSYSHKFRKRLGQLCAILLHHFVFMEIKELRVVAPIVSLINKILKSEKLLIN